ncbi:MAG: DUF1592 domain-containing protein [Polyangiaceae bacterium]|nr:DUF1592 domain-containing protein [Polyangiaceae bacterium]
MLLGATLALGCVGDIGGDDSKGPKGSGVGDDDDGAGSETGVKSEQPTTAIPRLSRREIDATIADVFGITGAAERNLPADPNTAVNPVYSAEVEVFDTLAATKSASQVFVDGLESMAFEVSRDFSANTAAVDALAGCTPAQAVDAACLESFIRNAGLRLWRRPLGDEEVAGIAAAVGPLATDPAAGAAGHYVAVRGAVAALIMSAELVYRSEIGADVGNGIVRLDNYELVSRLSYFLWGTAPSSAMLDRAAGAELSDQDLASMVDEMLQDPRGKEQMRVFHELWLRYTSLLVTDPQLAADMRAETEALVDRVLGANGAGTDWTALFTSKETFVTPSLAQHYGLSVPNEASWVPYGDDRAGLLSQGSFLSLSLTKQTDTLVSRRGAMIGRRLLCEVIMPPPPNVAVDMGVEVPEGSCKSDAYAAHASGSCAGCHNTIDGIGFGFERYDGVGRYREVENANPACQIDGIGTFEGETFSGPVDFVNANAQQISDCAVVNLLRFASRDWNASDERIERMTAAFRESGNDFAVLMRAVATDSSFRHRRDVALEGGQ